MLFDNVHNFDNAHIARTTKKQKQKTKYGRTKRTAERTTFQEPKKKIHTHTKRTRKKRISTTIERESIEPNNVEAKRKWQ